MPQKQGWVIEHEGKHFYRQNKFRIQEIVFTKLEIRVLQCFNLRLFVVQKSLGPEGVNMRMGFPGSFRSRCWLSEDATGFQGLCDDRRKKLAKFNHKGQSCLNNFAPDKCVNLCKSIQILHQKFCIDYNLSVHRLSLALVLIFWEKRSYLLTSIFFHIFDLMSKCKRTLSSIFMPSYPTELIWSFGTLQAIILSTKVGTFDLSVCSASM